MTNLDPNIEPDPDQSPPRRRPIWWWLFIMPGTVLLWIQYMFPSSGNVWASGRRYNADSALLKILYSLAVWGLSAIFLSALLFGRR